MPLGERQHRAAIVELCLAIVELGAAITLLQTSIRTVLAASDPEAEDSVGHRDNLSKAAHDAIARADTVSGRSLDRVIKLLESLGNERAGT